MSSDSHNPPDARARMATLPLRELTDVLKENARLREREAHFARVLSVADGGQYRNDWDGAIRRVLDERDRLRAALVAILNEFDPGENDPVARLAREALEAGER